MRTADHIVLAIALAPGVLIVLALAVFAIAYARETR